MDRAVPLAPVAQMDTPPNPIELSAPNPSTSPQPHTGPAGGRALPERFGRYRIERKLGEGGMGAVYLARDTALERPVALKVAREVHSSAEFSQRFRREAVAAASIDHPNLCPIYDVGEVDGVVYMAMRYIEGRPLSSLVADYCRRPPPEAARLVATMARAMAVVHQRGVVHRDLKPGNVMIPADGEPVIMDFGLAVRPTQDSRLTHSGAIVGTPAYMAPEQMRGDAVGPAADIYSLGLVLYELLTGRLPFRRGSLAEMMAAALYEHPQPPGQLRPGLPPRLESLCLRAISKRPEDRFGSMAEFAAALDDYLRHEAAFPSPGAGPPVAAESSAPIPRTVVGRPTGLVRRLGTWLWTALTRPFRRKTCRRPPVEDDRPSAPADSLPEPILLPASRTLPGTVAPESGALRPVEVLTPPPPSALSLPDRAGPPETPPPALPPEPLFRRPFGKYELLRKLGQGESGIVYLARHAEHGWQAALKVLPGARFADPVCAQRLLREARTGAGLRHPNLCQILDAGTEQGGFYLAMEYLEGKTLRSHLHEAGGCLTVPLACYHAYQLVDTLAYLARHDVVHRDVKPGNIMVCAGDRLKLMDLGLAKAPDPEEGRLTLSGIILGTPAYMAPEQIVDASRATPASDLYAAGATLFEMLTATTPFQAEAPALLMQKVLSKAAPDPRLFRPDLPATLADILVRLLDKEPGRRPDHTEVLTVLRAVCQGLAPLLPEPPPRPAPQPSERVTMTAVRNVSMVARIDRVAEQVAAPDGAPDGDDLLDLLPREEGKVRLGDYDLEARIGPRAAVNTYRSRHHLAGHPAIVRLLPLALSQMAPERLRSLLQQRGRLMQLSMQSPHLSRLVALSTARLREGTFDTLYYTVEDHLPGDSLERLIGSVRPVAADVETCLAGAGRGLWALHREGILHGNLHPGKLFFDRDAGMLRIADLSHARPAADAAAEAQAADAASAINDLDWLGDSQRRRRQYVAPEILCDGAPPGPLAEQYALGVVFVELLAGRLLRTHQNDLKLMKYVQEDLQDCLVDIAEAFPRLGRVLQRMVKIKAQGRFPDLGAVLNALQQGERPPQRQSESDTPQPTPTEGPPVAAAAAFDVFVSYRRKTGAEVARAIVERLQQRNVHAFLDVDALRAGPFDERLLDTIAGTPNFLIILSEGSLDRCEDEDDWLRREITHAIRTRRKIVPVLMPRFRMPEVAELPKELAQLPRYNNITYRHDYFDGFIDRLLEFLHLPTAGRVPFSIFD